MEKTSTNITMTETFSILSFSKYLDVVLVFHKYKGDVK